ncbi:MAG TPA: phage/plasmid replication protein [Hanamia sp.]
MIDTINFRLNHVSKYPLTLLKYEATTRTGQTVVEIDKDTGEVFENSKIRAILHHDSDSIIPLSKRAALHIPSSNYDLSYFYNITQDFITFEFSIPKYLYGTNIVQFVRFFSQDCDVIYDLLIDLVNGFFRKYTYEPIDMADVELTRLDLCYNQFFNSKYDALSYLGEQKELLSKFCRNSKNDFRTYDTSLLYVTKRYSFKIYHKGTEFKKNDRKELIKKNPTKHSLDDLQDISDRILRYEITFRKAQIDYLFEKNHLHDKYLGFLKNERTRKSMRLVNRKFYDRAIVFCEQSKHYVFAPVKTNEAVENQMVGFDRTIFACMFSFFWDYVKKYQLTRRLSAKEVALAIDEKNAKRDTAVSEALRRKLSFNKNTLVILALLAQHENLVDIRKSGLFNERTFYRYLAKLKEIGVVSDGRLLDMPPPSLDYMEYKAYFGHYHTN